MPKAKTETPKPKHVKDGVLTVTIWENTSAKGFPFNTFSLQRSYRDSEGQWKNTETFRKSDLLRLANLLTRAYNETTGSSSGDEDNE